MNCSIYNFKSKKGKDVSALRIVIGEYETLVFPNKIELLYLKEYLENEAHKDFKGKDLDDIASD